jgi:hypothetical protein
MTEGLPTYNPATERLQLTQATNKLIALYRLKAELKLKLDNLEVSIALREQELTPDGNAWEGPNAEARKYNKEVTFSQDPALQAMKASHFVISGEIQTLYSEIDGLLVDIKRIRWNTLSRLAEALYRNPVEIGTIGEEATEEMTEFQQVYSPNPESLVSGETVSVNTPRDYSPEEEPDVPF